MRTTIDLDEDMILKARQLTGIRGLTSLVREGLRALITWESARRIARLGGSDRRATAPLRRRPK